MQELYLLLLDMIGSMQALAIDRIEAGYKEVAVDGGPESKHQVCHQQASKDFGEQQKPPQSL